MITKFSTSKLSYTQRYRQMMAGSAYVPPAYELISTTVLSSSAACVTFAGLDTSAAAYKHLQIRYTARCSSAVAYPITVNAQLNDDSTVGNYKWHLIGGDSTAVASYNGQLTPAGLFTGAAAGGSANASAFSANIVDFLDFASTSKNKTMRSLGGSSASSTAINNEIRLYSSLWMSTAAITSIALTLTDSSNFVTGSRFSLYGLKG